MDISSVGSLSTALGQNVGESATILVQRKALDIQEQAAAQLLQTLPPVPSNPPNLGNNVDIKV